MFIPQLILGHYSDFTSIKKAAYPVRIGGFGVLTLND